MSENFACHLHGFSWREQQKVAAWVGVLWIVKLVSIDNRYSCFSNIEAVRCCCQVSTVSLPALVLFLHKAPFLSICKLLIFCTRGECKRVLIPLLAVPRLVPCHQTLPPIPSRVLPGGSKP